MAWRNSSAESELDRAIIERRQAEQLERVALLAFEPDELALLGTEPRRMLDMLIRRRLRQTLDPSLADALEVRRQFEDFCDRQSAAPSALWLTAALGNRSR
jgi:hypothetical protein